MKTFLISKTFGLNSEKLVKSCNYKSTVSDQNQNLAFSGNEIQHDKVLKEFIPQKFQAKVKKKKCFLCDQSNHMMNECLLLSEFRKHETYCKKMSIHVWKSWDKDKALYRNAAKINNNKQKRPKLKEKVCYYNFVSDESYELQNMKGQVINTPANGSYLKIYNKRNLQGQF